MPVDENNIKVQHACIKFKHNKIENWRKDQIERTWKKQNPKMPSTRRTDCALTLSIFLSLRGWDRRTSERKGQGYLDCFVFNAVPQNWY